MNRERYTGFVARLVRPLALCVTLLLGGAPVVATMCQVWCASAGSEQAAGVGAVHHHHHHDAEGSVTASTTDGAAHAWSAVEGACTHDAAIAPALASAVIKLVPPPSGRTEDAVAADAIRLSAFVHLTQVRTAGPPELTSRPLSLRL